MTIWIPDLKSQSGPKAIAIVDAMAADIAAGRLKAGEKLPPHRELAYQLNVSVGTVTRSYAEARRRGLVTAQVGSGTFVCDGRAGDQRFGIMGAPDEGGIDLSVNLAFCDRHQVVLDQALDELRSLPGSAELMEYQFAAGMQRHRIAGAEWMSRSEIEATPGRVVICQGAQQALAVAFSALTRPGDVILTEALTFPPAKKLASMFDIRFHGVTIDSSGLVPEALDAACRTTGAKLLYVIPTLQNPSGSIMPDERRREVARITRMHDVRIIEDDVYARLPVRSLTPIASYAPERTWYVTSVSKCLAPGLRIGYLLSPTDDIDPLVDRVRALGWMATPIAAEIVTLWMEDGTADRLIDWHRHENAARAALARAALGETGQNPNDSPHIWLDLPDQWRGSEFAAESLCRGVRVAEGGAFAVGRGGHRHGIRISLNAARSRDELRRGLDVVVDCLEDQPSTACSIL